MKDINNISIQVRRQVFFFVQQSIEELEKGM
jgi:hypothetical protein